MKGTRITLMAVLVALAPPAGGTGCSLIFVDKAPPDHASRRYFDCTSSYAAPVGDAVLGGVFAIGVIGSGSDGTTSTQESISGTVLVAAALASAAYGFLQVHDCQQAKQALALRLLEPDRMPLARAQAGGGPPPRGADSWLAQGPPPAAPTPNGPADGGLPEGGGAAAATADGGAPR